jgi:RND family efflux transporter MFP subunit
MVPLLILIVATGGAAAMVWTKAPPDKKEIPNDTLMVETAQLTPREVRFAVASQGSVGARTETTLVAEVSGTVLEVSPKFVVGGFFDEGEVLLRIDPADYQVAVELAKANLASMRAKLMLEVARAEQAEKEWAMSGRSRDAAPLLALRTPYLDEARANVLYAEADLKKAQRKLDRTSIRAPYQGMVKAKAVDIGQYVGVGGQLGETIAVDFAEVRLPLSDKDIAQLELPRPGLVSASAEAGPEVELITVIGGEEHRWTARVVRTEGVIDERSRVHYAVVRIHDPYGLASTSTIARPPLPIGSFVKARIQGIERSGLIAVPRHAVHGGTTVYVMDAEQHLQIREITVEGADDEFIYITSGLAETDRVITSAIDVPVVGRPLRTRES